ncbi:hypothetical protein NQ317_009989 [Molorchus minor]|uniref:Uncharacterized protein n=1 Tax=Molorchus minor TaxID=1323400 RepID=A0ABQ9K821_9CUCU|nr:hypothetical protein NQ317_009989 [Molorchus minor]
MSIEIKINIVIRIGTITIPTGTEIKKFPHIVIEKSEDKHKHSSDKKPSNSHYSSSYKEKSDLKVPNSGSSVSIKTDSALMNISSSLTDSTTLPSSNSDDLMKNILNDSFNSPVKTPNDPVQSVPVKKKDRPHKVKIQKPKSTDILGDILKDMNKCDPHI